MIPQMYREGENESPATQGRLLLLVGLFLVFQAAALTLAPLVRLRSWSAPLNFAPWAGLAVWGIVFAAAHLVWRRRLPYHDPYLLPLVGLIAGWGLLVIWRVAPGFGIRQTVWLALAGALLVVGVRWTGLLTWFRDYKYLWLTGGLLLTGLTLLLGTNPAGTGPRLWLGCCGVYVQPSEPLKLLLIVYLAAYLSDRQFLIPGLLPLLLPTLLMTGLTVLLLLFQRDLGTASIFLILYTGVIFFATGRRRVLIISAGILALAGALGFQLFEVVRIRVDAWLNPWLDPSGGSYQIVQSLLAVANGGLLGRGPGLGFPTVVPVNHSDFIFTAVAEEYGLVGSLGLIVAFAFLVARGMRIALRAEDNFRRYLAVGITTYLAAQMILIVGGNLRLLPLTGVTLPFVSYGGSSLLTAFFALLLLTQISNRGQAGPAPLPEPRAVREYTGLLLAGLLALALVNGWWAFVRGPDLLLRMDNPRRNFNDLLVPRGTLLDRDQEPLNLTEGKPGAYVRVFRAPDLGPIIGYTHQIYGQSGLEASLDDFLRGLQGYPAETVWWNHLLYGHPPPGLDLRLSLDLDLQVTAAEQLSGHSGGLVIVNARSGEILTMASHPTFDPNHLDEDWESLVQDPAAPLLNRAAQGQYHPGGILGPFLLSSVLAEGTLPDLPAELTINLGDERLDCAFPLDEDEWQAALARGCPGAVAALGNDLGGDQIRDTFEAFGLTSAPVLKLEVAPPGELAADQPAGTAALGGDSFRISPLQLALAAAALSAEGVRPAPRLAVSLDTPEEGWRVMPPESEPVTVLTPALAELTTSLLASENLPIWEVLAVTPVGADEALTWYLAGTLPDWQGTPVALALALEESDPGLVRQIGQALLTQTLQLR